MIVHRYDYASFLAAAEAAKARYYTSAWCGGLDRNQTLHHTRYGDDSNVPKATELLDRLQGAVETPRAVWRPNVAGAYPVVPEYLMGLPDCMRFRRRERDASSPITLYASIMAPAFEDAERMMQRGIAILALALKLQAIRPLSLYAVCPWVDTTLIIEIPTRPLSIAHAAFALSHPAYFRRLGHEVLYATGDWNTCINQDAHVPEILGMRSTDVYIGTGMATLNWEGTRQDYMAMRDNPVAWINTQVQRIIHGTRA